MTDSNAELVALGARDIVTERSIGLQLKYQDIDHQAFRTVATIDSVVPGQPLRVRPGTLFVAYREGPRQFAPESLIGGRVLKEVAIGFAIWTGPPAPRTKR